MSTEKAILADSATDSIFHFGMGGTFFSHVQVQLFFNKLTMDNYVFGEINEILFFMVLLALLCRKINQNLLPKQFTKDMKRYTLNLYAITVKEKHIHDEQEHINGQMLTAKI